MANSILIAALLAFGFVVGRFDADAECRETVSALLEVPAMEDCTTDDECMRHCPPPMDDPDCDGGPQS